MVYLYPYLNETTRTTRVRLVVPNAEGKLKPGMYAEVAIPVDLGEPLAVPDEAVMDTGARRIVFADLGGGRFEPREVDLGPRAGGARGTERRKAMDTRFAAAAFSALVFGAALGGLSGCWKEDSHASHSHAKAPAAAPAADEAKIVQEQLSAYPLQTCVVSGEKLGGMGEAVNLIHKGRLVRFCCQGCVKDFEKDPDKYLKILDEAAAKAGSRK